MLGPEAVGGAEMVAEPWTSEHVQVHVVPLYVHVPRAWTELLAIAIAAAVRASRFYNRGACVCRRNYVP